MGDRFLNQFNSTTNKKKQIFNSNDLLKSVKL